MKPMILVSILILGAIFCLALTSSEEPDYSLLERWQVPLECRWKIEDIYPSYSEWQKDFDLAKEEIGRIGEKSVSWTESAEKMFAFLSFLSDLQKRMEKLSGYARHQYNVEMTSNKHQQSAAAVQTLFVQLSAALAFFNDDILKVGTERFGEYLKAKPELEPYRFGIEKVLRMRQHILPRDIQEAVALTALFARHPSQANILLNDLEIPPAEVVLSDGSRIVLNTANYIRYRSAANAGDRSQVMRTYWQNHRRFEKTQAMLFDAALKEHLFRAKIHKYQDCLEAALKPENIDRRVYFQLIETVHQNLDLLHRYLLLKKKLLGLEKMNYEDIYASAVPAIDKYFSYQQAQQIILAALKPLGKEYVSALQEAFRGRWIDVYPNRGKQSGAYSGGVYGVHPYIKMNYNGRYDSLSTLAHELGHALHSFFSDRSQPYELADYPVFLAEIASTFNENLLLNYLLKTETNDLFRLYLLDSYLDNFRGTIFRQTLFAEFELAMHQHVEAGNSLTADWLNHRYLQLTRQYYGHERGVINVDDYIQNEWSGIPHFFMNFYVYQYSTGLIASIALSDLVLNTKDGGRNYLRNFLKAGGSDYPLNILNRVGVDLCSAQPAQQAFRRFRDYLELMEEIVKKIENDKRRKK